jgi:hypothetical protein
LLYNTIRPHASLGYKPPAPEVFVSCCSVCLAGGSDGAKKSLTKKNREYNFNAPRPGRSSVTGRGLETGDRFACAVADPFSPSYNARVIASTLFDKALCANAELKNREYNLNVPRPGRSSVTGRGLETGDSRARVAHPFSPSYNARVIASTLFDKALCANAELLPYDDTKAKGRERENGKLGPTGKLGPS